MPTKILPSEAPGLRSGMVRWIWTGGQYLLNERGSFLDGNVLPDAQDPPAIVLELSSRTPITLDVCLQLRSPPSAVVLDRHRVHRAPVPEAAVDEHGDL
jgi:hypothetical protein